MTTRGHFNLILWGFVLTILDIQVGGIDLLPDSLGYLLVAIGAGALSSSNRQFVTACVLAALLVPLSFFEGFLADGRVLGIVCSVLDCALIWFLLGGVIQLAESREKHAFAQRVTGRRYVFIAGSVGLAAFGLFMAGGGALSPLLMTVSAGVMLVLVAMLILLLREARMELGETDAGMRD